MMQENPNEIIKNMQYKKPYFKKCGVAIYEGKGNIMISAPHANFHVRDDRTKKCEVYTGTIVKMIHELTNCHIIYSYRKTVKDPNYDEQCTYQKQLERYCIDKNIEYVIDLHGLASNDKADIEIGTNNYKNLFGDASLVDSIIQIFNGYGIENVRVDKKYKAGPRTLSGKLNKNINIKTMQMEINRKYRKKNNDPENFQTIVNSLVDIVLHIQRISIPSELDFGERYDKVLDIKPLYTYQRKIGKVPFNYVGLEIEIAVNYTRDRYSFIRNLLKNIKKLIGENGYFVKDGTILGDYSFEIILDPLSPDKIRKIYSKLLSILNFSDNTIVLSKEHNCGIHMNFNQYDILDLKESHKRLTSYFVDHPQYFEENIYKRFVFNWDFDSYKEFQKEVANQYIWVNYITKKVVELRNVRVDLTPKELYRLINDVNQCLFYDKIDASKVSDSYSNMNMLYNNIFANKKNMKINKIIDKDGFLIIDMTSDKAEIIKPNKKIKDEINKLRGDN